MARTTTHYSATLVRQALRLGLDVDAILAEAGIPAKLAMAEDQWLDNDNLTALIKILWRETGDEMIGLGVAPIRMGSWALACDYMLAADNLSDLYRRGQRFYNILPPESQGMRFSIEGDRATVELLGYDGGQDPDHFLVEFMTVVWHRFPCWVIDEYIPVQRAFFSYAEPSHSWFYEELLQCRIAFNQATTGFSFSTKLLDRPLKRNRRELELWLRNSPADLMYVPGRDNSVTAYIRSELQRALEEQMCFPAFDAICANLHISPQVVRRRLNEEGTTYQKIKDVVRCNLVKDLLIHPDPPIAQIAERAGFTEPAALSRAFKQWTGVTPIQYREQRAQKAKR